MSGRSFGKVSSSLWYSEKFGSVRAPARMLYVWLITTEAGNAAGVFRVSPDMVPPNACPRRAVRRTLRELQRSGLIEYDEPLQLVSIGQYLRHCPINSWTHAVAAMNSLSAHGTSKLTTDRALNVQKTPGFVDALGKNNDRTKKAVQRFFNVFEEEL